jgi:hypothetical protein
LSLYPQGKSPCYPLDRRLGGPKSCSGHDCEEKDSRLPLIEIICFYNAGYKSNNKRKFHTIASVLDKKEDMKIDQRKINNISNPLEAPKNVVPLGFSMWHVKTQLTLKQNH